MEQKFEFLKESCENGRVFGAPVIELLNIGGDKNLMWVDIDTRDHAAFKVWESRGFPFPRRTYRAITSATGRIHLYVNTDRPLEIGECFSMCEWVRDRAPASLASSVDRVYGPNNLEPVFIPGAAQEKPILPQDLMRFSECVFRMPDIEGSIYSEWRKRLG